MVSIFSGSIRLSTNLRTRFTCSLAQEWISDNYLIIYLQQNILHALSIMLKV